MKRILDLNPNTKLYWNSVYKSEDKRVAYAEVTKGQNGASQRMDYAVKEVNPGDKVLDIGCGVGLFTKMVKEAYPDCEVWGTDISSDAIEENKLEGKDITYFHQYIGQQDKIPDSYFDVVFSGEVLEHIEEPESLFKDAYRALKQGGRFILTTPNENRIRSEEHIWEFNHEDIDKLFEENGFERPRFVDLPDMEWWYVIFAAGIKK